MAVVERVVKALADNGYISEHDDLASVMAVVDREQLPIWTIQPRGFLATDFQPARYAEWLVTAYFEVLDEEYEVEQDVEAQFAAVRMGINAMSAHGLWLPQSSYGSVTAGDMLRAIEIVVRTH